jgi:8-oxo-dGTP diphosphatase
MTPGPSTQPPERLPRVGSAVVVTNGQSILLGVRAKEPNRGKWVLPGGKIEPFESIEEAAKREVLEETGLEIKVTGQLGALEIINPPEEHRLIVFSSAEVFGGALRPGSDLAELTFCSPEDLETVDLSDFVRGVLETFGYIPRPAESVAA